MAGSSASQPSQRRNPSLLACIACRRAHIRCTGKGPTCDRCVEKGALCAWVESRRGLRPSPVSSAFSFSNQGLHERHQQHIQPQPPGHNSTRHSSSATSPTAINEDADPLLDSFYEYFYPSHPFVLPPQMRDRLPDFLKAVMRFGGSHFVPIASREALKDAAVAQVVPDAPDNGFKVQAFILLAIISFSRNEQEEGGAYLKSAITLALWIGLHKKDFAIRFGNDNATIAESWRRTWWDLFIAEGLIGFFTGQTSSTQLRTLNADVLLPGECELYTACSPSKDLRSIEEMQDRAFFDDDFQWSSFAYKVEAMCLLRSVSAIGTDSFAVPNTVVESLDQRLSNFRFSLPGNKKEALQPNGKVDEVMFGALMTMSCAEIALHRPRSSLVSVRNHYRTACTLEETQGMTAVDYRSHDAKVIRAANAITNLLTAPSAPILHTPCFTCALTVATTVQLPAIVQDRSEERLRLKQRIQLSITAMGSISKVWPMALATKSQIASFAREVLKSNIGASSLQSPLPQLVIVPSASEPSTGLSLGEDSSIEAQAWFMDLVAIDSGPTAAEVDEWLHSTTEPA